MEEDSKLKFEKQPEKERDGWRDREEFIKRGPCKEVYVDLQDSLMNVTKKSDIQECLKNLDMCMKTHSDYYQPLLEANEAMAKEVGDRIMKDILHLNTPIDEVTDEEEDKLIATLWEKTCCKESLTEFAVNCVLSDEEAGQLQMSSSSHVKKNNEEVTCNELLTRLYKCFDAHPHHPFLAVKKSMEENMEKANEALFSEPK